MTSGIVDKVNNLIVHRSRIVIAVFLIVTAVFAVGSLSISTDSGTSQFTVDLESAEALESINEEFSPRRVGESGSGGQTQLIQDRQNVLSKPALVEQAKFEREITTTPKFNVESVTSVASTVAVTLEPTATTPEQRVNALEGATQSEIRNTVRSLLADDSLRSLVSTDYNSQSVHAGASISIVVHGEGGSGGPAAGVSSSPELSDVQTDMSDFAKSEGYSITVFGSGILGDELSQVIGDSLIIVVPVAILMILMFLVFSYKDPFDIVIGLSSLVMAVIWTFGFLGITGRPFTQMLVAVPPLLLAVGIDFGIHTVNRYREKRSNNNSPQEAMKNANKPLIGAFSLVAFSTVVGFASNLISPLPPLQDFAVVASVGIVFTALIFGVFLPALKLEVDKLRDRYNIPTFSTKSLGEDGSVLGRSIVKVTQFNLQNPKVVLLTVLLLSSGGAVYATGVDSSFSDEIFLPPAETPAHIEASPVDIGDYESPKTLDFIENNFKSASETTLIVYVDANMRSDSSLEQVNRMNQNPPEILVKNSDGTVKQTGIISVIQSKEFSQETQKLINKNDRNNNGIPDQNLGKVYDSIEEEYPQLDLYLTDSRNSAVVTYTVKDGVSNSEVSRAAADIQSSTRLDVTPTGEPIVFDDVGDFLTDTTIDGMILAIFLTTVGLSIIFVFTRGSFVLGMVNTIPVVFGVVFTAATMRFLGINLNPLTATTLSISIGIGLDYAIHLSHRIIDEMIENDSPNKAILKAVRGTGGALFGSALTTVFGIGSLALAITPILSDFGLVIGIGISYSFIFSFLVLPPVFLLLHKHIEVFNTDRAPHN